MTSTELKPFDESIVDVIDGISVVAAFLAVLADIIKRTKIPKNHDAIAEAWMKKMRTRVSTMTSTVLWKA
jgi:hypothetical protein